MQQVTLCFDLISLNPRQMEAFLALLNSFQQPHVIPTSDENAEHAVSPDDYLWAV